MNTPDNAEAKAPAPEVVADDKIAVAAKEDQKPDEEAEATEEEAEAEAEEDAEAEGAKEVEEGDDRPTKSKLRREKQKARIAELEQSVARLSEQVQAAERNKPGVDGLGPKPDKSKYDDEVEYAADLAAWKTEERIIARQTKAHETTSTTVRTDAAAKKAELFRERAMALSDRYPDIEAKVFQDNSLPMSDTMAETLMDSEKGPEVAYYLSANREMAQRIKLMKPLAAARELGRIEATLSLPKSKTQSTAPPPANTLSGSLKKISVDPNTLTGAAYRAWRAKQG